jgi:hypothetical protein
MKLFFFILALFSLASCDPYKFGFEKNPAYVLNEAFKAITNLDEETFIEVTGKEALCLYGNAQGISYLRDRILINQESAKLEPKLLSSKHLTSPKYVGYWSYYQERYSIKISDNIHNDVILEVIVDCDYGTAGVKDDKYLNLERKKYPKKECRAVKLLPQKFENLPLPQKCEMFKVEL